MMTQARIALNINSSPGEESLAKTASARKQAGRQKNGIGHVGIRATNPAASAEFYRDVLGMEIVGGSMPDHPLGATAFLSSRPSEESHEIALFADPAFAHVAFKVSSLAELRSFQARVLEKNIPIKFAFNHRVSFAFYFDDPDGNMIEVYWPTGDLSRRQPYVEPLDLSQPDEVLLEPRNPSSSGFGRSTVYFLKGEAIRKESSTLRMALGQSREVGSTILKKTADSKLNGEARHGKMTASKRRVRKKEREASRQASEKEGQTICRSEDAKRDCHEES